MVMPSIAGGALAAGGSIAAAGIGANSAKNNNAQMMDYQKHRYQYATEDLKAAGLNPILAVHGMTPGNAPALQQPNLSGLGSGLASAANVITQGYQAKTGRQAQESQAKLQQLQGANSAADTLNKVEQAKQIEAQTRYINEQTITQGAQRALMLKQGLNYSANTAKTQYDTTQSRVLSDYLNTATGAESARVNLDASRGGTVGLLNTLLSSFHRDNPPNSAKKVNQSKLKPNAYQRGLINNYRR